MYHQQLPTSIERWRIFGTLTTMSPCHIGDGNRLRIRDRDCERDFVTEPDVEYASVMVSYDGKPVVPATSLKGALRAWADTHCPNKGLIDRVFGSSLAGGVVTFHHGRFLDVPTVEEPKARLWSTRRSTAISAHVALDEKTRTAKPNLLFHLEFIPVGARFEVSFSAQGATDEERDFLLYILENAFATTDRPATLGSDGANGWGRMTWVPGELKKLDGEAWLKVKTPRTWQEKLIPVNGPERSEWLAGGKRVEALLTGSDMVVRPSVRFRLLLQFDGALLVNDPSRAVKGGKAPISHAAIRREDGSPYLPSQSIRGAFRAQASRIWRTLVAGGAHHASNVELPEDPEKEKDAASLSPLTKVFGATGWRAPLEIDDFELESGGRNAEAVLSRQEFVAVDRFTGGAADRRKFAAVRLWRPRFAGEIRVRTERLFEAERPAGSKALTTAFGGEWVWMLLALTLRDWAEGDGAIGFGRSKGYGTFRASLEPGSDSVEVALLRDILRREPAALSSQKLESWAQSLKDLTDSEKKEAA